MPELPEVETVTNSIKKHLLDKNFSSLSINWPKTLHNFSIKDFNNQIKRNRSKAFIVEENLLYLILSNVLWQFI